MPSAMPMSETPARVPAWKRLGLKLKFAKGEQQIETQPSASPVSETKRKGTVDDHEDAVSKRIKTSKPKQKTRSLTPIQSPLASETNGRRKSVQFTADTKTTDGESTKQLFNAWVAEHKKENPSFDPNSLGAAFSTPEPPKVIEDVDSAIDESERRVKRVKAPKTDKKKKIAKTSKSSNSVTSTRKSNGSLDSSLAYLTAFQRSKSSWKFNKVHQTNILKNAFNLELIPSSYSEALYLYIAGLKGGARTHLRDTALAVKVKDQEQGEQGFPKEMANTSKCQREYEAALAEYAAFTLAHEAPPEMGYEEGVLMGLSDFAMKPRMEKRMRAERIMAELSRQAAEETNGNGSASTYNPVKGVNNDHSRLRDISESQQKSRRKRKQRTAVVDLTSSSEDSSDSNDDRSNDGSAAKPIAIDHGHSSNGTSSSGSDDENEEESSGTSESAE